MEDVKQREADNNETLLLKRTVFSLPNTFEQLVREAVTCDVVVQALAQLDNWGVKVK